MESPCFINPNKGIDNFTPSAFRRFSNINYLNKPFYLANLGLSLWVPSTYITNLLQNQDIYFNIAPSLSSGINFKKFNLFFGVSAICNITLHNGAINNTNPNDLVSYRFQELIYGTMLTTKNNLKFSLINKGNSFKSFITFPKFYFKDFPIKISIFCENKNMNLIPDSFSIGATTKFEKNIFNKKHEISLSSKINTKGKIQNMFCLRLFKDINILGYTRNVVVGAFDELKLNNSSYDHRVGLFISWGVLSSAFCNRKISICGYEIN